MAELEAEKRRLEEEINALEAAQSAPPPTDPVQTDLSNQEKIGIFRDLFRGREDVFPVRWENAKSGKSGYAIACRNEWVSGICRKPQVKCSECAHKAFLPATDDVIRFHLSGKDARGKPFCAGVYPMLLDETCWFLAADFDKEAWHADVTAFVQTCMEYGIPAHVERSRSGNGGHVWVFFAEPVSAADARKLGAYLLTKTMERYPELGFESYDRLFPSQDTLPKGGLGNLIALPLQFSPRQLGNSVFVDKDFRPHRDQWAYLSTAERVSAKGLGAFLAQIPKQDSVIGLPFPEDEEFEKTPWAMPPSRTPALPDLPSLTLPERLQVVLGDQIYIRKAGLAPSLRNRLLRLAAFQNPEFYRAQAMRLPTFGKPRVIACAEDYADHIALPRGVLGALQDLATEAGILLEVDDQRYGGARIKTRFTGSLTQKQDWAAKALLAEDAGVLSATTGFGKTVLAASLIASRGVNTLILVHRRQLLDQWLTRLETFLDTSNTAIGHVGSGKRKLSGKIDVALMQSLVKRGEVDDCVADYGQLIVDECHHISAASFELVARRSKARYVLGLTATPYRKDGHHPIIFMQCGPVRYRVDAKGEAATRSFNHSYFSRPTEFRLPLGEGAPPIQSIYQMLARNEVRNDLIFDDVLRALDAGRSPVLLTERREHVAYFADRFKGFAKNIIVLQGGMGAKQRQAAYNALKDVPEKEERLLIATGRYLGEGFDDARLDTLFLTMPVSWKGTLAQYAGRLHREHHNKKEVVVVDYADLNVPALARMHQRRTSGCKNLGYSIASELPWEIAGKGA
ncbi:DEAD/DEAH box helicase family protein [Psychromarinibacter sp. C21-152]|uniref:DEAD/DEAH box helicase family protein n=1 Tax=Psychromarinibacter sediminicola TaxID=3033385 RepID=A0AAE3NN89_9RHOB|nr:DEAD/DEAH box helicase [Psychromarinibacter sediminicola]MDF0599419.1 DEAD/DEAH box helicase family protein [Psychromarinibacter sediminicola]